MNTTEASGKLTLRELALITWRNLIAHEVLTRTSAIAFSSMMASVPFLILALTAFIYLLPDLSGAGSLGIGNLTPEQVEGFLTTAFPPDVAIVISDQIAHIQHQPPIGLLSISIFVLLWMASTVFVDIMDALNRIYGVVETRAYWKLRLNAIMMMLINLVIGLVALIVMLAWPQILSLFRLSGEDAQLATALKWVVVPIAVMGSMAMTFRMGPASHQKSRWITPGSIFGTIIFICSTMVFREYVQSFASYNRIYGSLGGVMALMFWFWLSSLVLLVAAEMNKVIEYAVTRSTKLKPESGGKEVTGATNMTAATEVIDATKAQELTDTPTPHATPSVDVVVQTDETTGLNDVTTDLSHEPAAPTPDLESEEPAQ